MGAALSPDSTLSKCRNEIPSRSAIFCLAVSGGISLARQNFSEFGVRGEKGAMVCHMPRITCSTQKRRSSPASRNWAQMQYLSEKS
jgi:hypothetical protein